MSWFRQLKSGIRNLFRWLPVIWNDRDWDWAFLANIMEYKLRLMAASTGGWHVADAERAKKQMLICAALLRRLREEPYSDMADAIFKEHDRAWALHIAYLGDQDATYLGRMLGKHLRDWWD